MYCSIDTPPPGAPGGAPEHPLTAAAKALEGAEGLPVNVQIATLPYEDELCLRLMEELEAALDE